MIHRRGESVRAPSGHERRQGAHSFPLAACHDIGAGPLCRAQNPQPVSGLGGHPRRTLPWRRARSPANAVRGHPRRTSPSRNDPTAAVVQQTPDSLTSQRRPTRLLDGICGSLDLTRERRTPVDSLPSSTVSRWELDHRGRRSSAAKPEERSYTSSDPAARPAGRVRLATVSGVARRVRAPGSGMSCRPG
jgi:hypothetical protein